MEVMVLHCICIGVCTVGDFLDVALGQSGCRSFVIWVVTFFFPVLREHRPKMSQIAVFPLFFLLLSLVIAPFFWSPAFVARPENVGVGLLTNKCFMELYNVYMDT
jgi:hypothetical protein